VPWPVCLSPNGRHSGPEPPTLWRAGSGAALSLFELDTRGDVTGVLLPDRLSDDKSRGLRLPLVFFADGDEIQDPRLSHSF
jgi:hypothetical protein